MKAVSERVWFETQHGITDNVHIIIKKTKVYNKLHSITKYLFPDP